MKKLITTVFLIVCISIPSGFAQLAIEGTDEFGRIFDLTYDAFVPNKVYAHTLGNHLVVSDDNGENWEVLYSLSLGQEVHITQLKLTPDGTKLTFAANTPNQPHSAVMVLDLATSEIIKTFDLPSQPFNGSVSFYDFYNDDTDVLIINSSYRDRQGGNGGSVYYTIDGGVTWSTVYDIEEYETVFVNQVAISPDNPNTLFLTRGNGSQGVNGGLLISEDGGQNWVEKLAGVIVTPIAFDPSNSDTILVGTGIGSSGVNQNLYKSVDGGETFEIVPITWTSGILDCINVIQYNPLNPSQIIILEENEVAVSEDGGTTWENFVYLDDDPETYYYGLAASYNPNNSEEILISTNYFPMLSSDAGETMDRITSPYYASTGNMDIYVDETTANLYYGVQFGYVYRNLVTQEESAYEILPLNHFSNNPGITQYADTFTPNRVYSFISGFMGSSLRVSDDNGTTVNQLASVYKNNFTAVATYPDSQNTILAAFAGFEPNETILKKINFSDINNIIETDINLPVLDFINGILIDEEGDITIAIGAEIYSTTDDGATWTHISNGLEDLDPVNDLIFELKVDPLDSNNMAIATSKGVYISWDGGESWEKKYDELVFQVAFSTETPGVLIATTFSSQVSKFTIHYSTDHGDTWETINNEQLLNIAARSSVVTFDENAAKVYVGSYDLGLLTYTIDLSLIGTPENSIFDQVVVFPNPTQDFINIKTNYGEVSKVSLYTINGQKVLDSKDVEQIDVQSFNSGIYLLKITTDEKDTYFKRVVIE